MYSYKKKQFVEKTENFGLSVLQHLLFIKQSVVEIQLLDIYKIAAFGH